MPPPARMPLLTALAAQLVAGALVFGGALALARATGEGVPLVALLALQGVLAALLGLRLRLQPWWVPIQLVLPSAVAVGWFWRLPAWIYLTAFAGLALVFWNAARGGVPLYLTNRETRAALAGLLPDKAGFRFLDLGSGLAGPVAALARRRPDGDFTGIESAPVLFALGWLRLRFSGLANARIRYRDFWAEDLGGYDVVYAFLSPVPMPALVEKARREMRPGSLLISNTFQAPDRPADEIVEVGDRRRTRLHLWRM
ncbi:MAG: hypothetical protein ACE5GT_12015 [Rhodospirillales bacterium]